MSFVETAYERVTRKPEVMDSRDLIEARTQAQEELDNPSERHDEEEVKEFQDLIEAVDGLEGAGIEDFPYGATLIRADYFKEYAQEFAEGIGRMDRTADWPYNHIDWDAAADDLRQDYSSVEFLDEEYYAR